MTLDLDQFDTTFNLVAATCKTFLESYQTYESFDMDAPNVTICYGEGQGSGYEQDWVCIPFDIFRARYQHVVDSMKFDTQLTQPNL